MNPPLVQARLLGRTAVVKHNLAYICVHRWFAGPFPAVNPNAAGEWRSEMAACARSVPGRTPSELGRGKILGLTVAFMRALPIGWLRRAVTLG